MLLIRYRWRRPVASSKNLSETIFEASEEILPDEGGVLNVDDPDSPLNGLTLTVPPGAVSEPTVFTVGSATNVPPLTPACFGVLLQLGPSGVQFSQPVTVSVPHPAGLSHPAALEVYCYDAASGRWSKSGIHNVRHVTDSPDHFVVFEADHFTIFAVTPELKATDVNLDGNTNAVDVQLVINAALGHDISPCSADVNQDETANAIDVQLTINGAVGLK